MAEYIKRTDVMKICEGYSEHCFSSNDAKGQDIADRILYDVVEIPTADVEAVKWIDVNERLPESYMNCLVYYKHAYNNEDGYWAIGVSYYNGEKFLIDWVYQVTHWMPLPEPPTKGEIL